MKYKDAITDIDIKKLIGLWHVPEVEEAIVSETQRLLEGKCGRQIEKFKRTKQSFHKTLFSGVVQGIEGPFFWFELIRYKDFEWRIVHIEPMPPPETPPYLILPWDIIDELTQHPAKPDLVVEKSIQNAEKGRTDLRFVRYSNFHLFGTVNIINSVPPVADSGAGENRQEKEKDQQPAVVKLSSDTDIGQVYRKIHHYLDKYPQDCEEFIRRFLAMKPVETSGRIKI